MLFSASGSQVKITTGQSGARSHNTVPMLTESVDMYANFLGQLTEDDE